MKRMKIDKILKGGMIPVKQDAKRFVNEAVAIRRIKDKLKTK